MDGLSMDDLSIDFFLWWFSALSKDGLTTLTCSQMSNKEAMGMSQCHSTKIIRGAVEKRGLEKKNQPTNPRAEQGMLLSRKLWLDAALL